MQYLGHLIKKDPLYSYLKRDILPQMQVFNDRPDFQVYRLNASNQVYLYRETHTDRSLIGKFFFGFEGRSWETAQRCMEREYQNLIWLRDIGFNDFPHCVARPYGCNGDINCVLIEEYSHATPFTKFLSDAAVGKRKGQLFKKLTALAYFLSQLHNRTAFTDKVYFEQEACYFLRLLEKLSSLKHLRENEAISLRQLLQAWKSKACMHEDVQVIVHGDTTPANLLFGNDLSVVAIDLERMKRSDRVFDLGRVAGEIKHFFMREGHQISAEPFIGHFLWEYCCHFPEREKAFESITRRLPFYLGMTLLRIARNSWVTNSYRRQLIKEALLTLGSI